MATLVYETEAHPSSSAFLDLTIRSADALKAAKVRHAAAVGTLNLDFAAVSSHAELAVAPWRYLSPTYVDDDSPHPATLAAREDPHARVALAAAARQLHSTSRSSASATSPTARSTDPRMATEGSTPLDTRLVSTASLLGRVARPGTPLSPLFFHCRPRTIPRAVAVNPLDLAYHPFVCDALAPARHGALTRIRIGEDQAVASDRAATYGPILYVDDAPHLPLGGQVDTGAYASYVARRVVRPGDRVLDCFFGLGETADAALVCGAAAVVTCEALPTVVDYATLLPYTRHIFLDERLRVMRGQGVLQLLQSPLPLGGFPADILAVAAEYGSGGGRTGGDDATVRAIAAAVRGGDYSGGFDDDATLASSAADPLPRSAAPQGRTQSGDVVVAADPVTGLLLPRLADGAQPHAGAQAPLGMSVPTRNTSDDDGYATSAAAGVVSRYAAYNAAAEGHGDGPSPRRSKAARPLSTALHPSSFVHTVGAVVFPALNATAVRLAPPLVGVPSTVSERLIGSSLGPYCGGVPGHDTVAFAADALPRHEGSVYCDAVSHGWPVGAALGGALKRLVERIHLAAPAAIDTNGPFASTAAAAAAVGAERNPPWLFDSAIVAPPPTAPAVVAVASAEFLTLLARRVVVGGRAVFALPILKSSKRAVGLFGAHPSDDPAALAVDTFPSVVASTAGWILHEAPHQPLQLDAKVFVLLRVAVTSADIAERETAVDRVPLLDERLSRRIALSVGADPAAPATHILTGGAVGDNDVPLASHGGAGGSPRADTPRGAAVGADDRNVKGKTTSGQQRHVGNARVRQLAALISDIPPRRRAAARAYVAYGLRASRSATLRGVWRTTRDALDATFARVAHATDALEAAAQHIRDVCSDVPAMRGEEEPEVNRFKKDRLLTLTAVEVGPQYNVLTSRQQELMNLRLVVLRELRAVRAVDDRGLRPAPSGHGQFGLASRGRASPQGSGDAAPQVDDDDDDDRAARHRKRAVPLDYAAARQDAKDARWHDDRDDFLRTMDGLASDGDGDGGPDSGDGFDAPRGASYDVFDDGRAAARRRAARRRRAREDEGNEPNDDPYPDAEHDNDADGAVPGDTPDDSVLSHHGGGSATASADGVGVGGTRGSADDAVHGPAAVGRIVPQRQPVRDHAVDTGDDAGRATRATTDEVDTATPATAAAVDGADSSTQASPPLGSVRAPVPPRAPQPDLPDGVYVARAAADAAPYTYRVAPLYGSDHPSVPPTHVAATATVAIGKGGAAPPLQLRDGDDVDLGAALGRSTNLPLPRAALASGTMLYGGLDTSVMRRAVVAGLEPLAPAPADGPFGTASSFVVSRSAADVADALAPPAIPRFALSRPPRHVRDRATGTAGGGVGVYVASRHLYATTAHAADDGHSPPGAHTPSPQPARAPQVDGDAPSFLDYIDDVDDDDCEASATIRGDGAAAPDTAAGLSIAAIAAVPHSPPLARARARIARDAVDAFASSTRAAELRTRLKQTLDVIEDAVTLTAFAQAKVVQRAQELRVPLPLSVGSVPLHTIDALAHIRTRTDRYVSLSGMSSREDARLLVPLVPNHVATVARACGVGRWSAPGAILASRYQYSGASPATIQAMEDGAARGGEEGSDSGSYVAESALARQLLDAAVAVERDVRRWVRGAVGGRSARPRSEDADGGSVDDADASDFYEVVYGEAGPPTSGREPRTDVAGAPAGAQWRALAASGALPAATLLRVPDMADYAGDPDAVAAAAADAIVDDGTALLTHLLGEDATDGDEGVPSLGGVDAVAESNVPSSTAGAPPSLTLGTTCLPATLRGRVMGALLTHHDHYDERRLLSRSLTLAGRVTPSPERWDVYQRAVLSETRLSNATETIPREVLDWVKVLSPRVYRSNYRDAVAGRIDAMLAKKPIRQNAELCYWPELTLVPNPNLLFSTRYVNPDALRGAAPGVTFSQGAQAAFASTQAGPVKLGTERNPIIPQPRDNLRM